MRGCSEKRNLLNSIPLPELPDDDDDDGVRGTSQRTKRRTYPYSKEFIAQYLMKGNNGRRRVGNRQRCKGESYTVNSG